MRIAYEASAEYVLLFNYLNLENNVCGVMKYEHFDALERFWNDMVKNPEVVQGNIDAETVWFCPETADGAWDIQMTEYRAGEDQTRSPKFGLFQVNF